MSESAAIVRLPNGTEHVVVGAQEVVRRTVKILAKSGFDRFRRLR